MTEYLALEDLLALTAELGVGPVRDLGLLESAVRRPATILWGRDAYTTINEKAAALLDSVVRNHPLGGREHALGMARCTRLPGYQWSLDRGSRRRRLRLGHRYRMRSTRA